MKTDTTTPTPTFTQGEQLATEIIFYLNSQPGVEKIPALRSGPIHKTIAETINIEIERARHLDANMIAQVLQTFHRVQYEADMDRILKIFGNDDVGEHVWKDFRKNSNEFQLSKFGGNAFKALAKEIERVLQAPKQTPASE